MNSNFTTGMNKPSIFTAQTYGTKTTVEVDHSDLSLDEVMDAFQTLIIGMGYHENSFKNWLIERADEYRETDAEDLKEKLEAWKFEDDDNELRHHNSFWQGYEASKKDSEGYESGELENDFFGEYDESDKRMDIIGQNGNEGLHYRATEEDEDEFSNDGGFDGNPHFEWDGTPEDDDNLFEGEAWTISQKLIGANERYKSEVKKMNTKKKKDKK
jgi:hypothetical protein